MLPLTSVVASILAIIFVHLSFLVIKLRRKNQVRIGTGGVEELERAIRAHANFAEYVPLGLILMACLEANGASWWLILLSGTALILGRIIHAIGVQEPPPHINKRVLGMKITFFTLIALVALNLGQTAIKLIS
jgi:uncharacterized membrane protein YecN with MAPEG domain